MPCMCMNGVYSSLLLLKKLENGYEYIIETLQTLKQNTYQTQREEFTRCTE